jgi:NADPH2:quinone reductase
MIRDLQTIPNSYFRSGLYPSPKPEILGREAEGTIVKLGPSGDFYGLKEGDKVVWMKTASYAEYSAAAAVKAIKIPDGIKPGVAAAACLQGLTALTMIRESYEVKSGDWILVHAAAGGTGLLLCQLLKAIGARVIGTASTGGKCELAKENGAEFVIDYSQEKVVDKVLELTNGNGKSSSPFVHSKTQIAMSFYL